MTGGGVLAQDAAVNDAIVSASTRNSGIATILYRLGFAARADAIMEIEESHRKKTDHSITHSAGVGPRPHT